MRLRSFVFLVLIPLASPARGEGPLVRLLRWDGRAVATATRGPGDPMFRLDAITSWSADAPHEPSRYAVKVSLPAGGSFRHPLAVKNAPPSRSLTVLVPAGTLRDLRPDAVKVSVAIVEADTGSPVSDDLVATIEDFANPGPGLSDEDRGPFGWGRPIEVPEPGAAPLPRRSPSGMPFSRVNPGGGKPGFFLATTEATNGEVANVLDDYDPRASRSDDFRLEDSDQPAVGLTPRRTRDFLEALAKADSSGLTYRLPTEREWLAAARAGQTSPFWWGDEPTHPEGANFLGPEPSQTTDATAPSSIPRDGSGFLANPWGFLHTFGNVSEWVTREDGEIVRIGGHFRTEPASPMPAEAGPNGDADVTGSDPFVGVRPALKLSADTGAAIARKALGEDGAWKEISVAFDPDRAMVTLSGHVPSNEARKLADARLLDLWFVAAVENQLEGPGVAKGNLASLEGRILHRRRKTILGRTLDEMTVPVRWAPELPVEGSRWYVNVYSASGAHFDYPLIGGTPDPREPLLVVIDRSVIGMSDQGIRVALSLGGPAHRPDSANVVSNVAGLE